MATIDVEGIQRSASLLLLEDARVGDYVIVHAGFAIQRIDETAAQESLAFLREAMKISDSDANPDGSGGSSGTDS